MTNPLKQTAKQKRENARLNALEALLYSYGRLHAMLVMQNRSTIGDSGLQQISNAINGLGGKTPDLDCFLTVGPKGIVPVIGRDVRIP